ncbi:MAG: molybdopterin-dependent oxidoreductase [Caulobacteraceae bacterium]
MSRFITRRRALITGAAGGGLLLAGCDQITSSPSVQRVLSAASDWTTFTQRLLLSGGQLAREYKPSDIAPVFKGNGTLDPGYDDYEQQVADKFVNWRIAVDGLVNRPLSLSVADLRALPSRTQITRHDCVEGWSVIGQWTGVQLGLLLKAAGLKPGARYAVFYCADNLDGEPAKGGAQSPGQYYESIGLADAVHPQTLLAYELNGKPLAVANGAPIRLRAERLLGYKQAKYIQRVQIVDSLAGISGGKGGYWEDRGYDWYAGI